MKRTTVVLDEQLLEKARQTLGEKTYSSTITKALQKVVQQADFWEKYRKFEKLAHTEGVFHPDYIQEKLAKSLSHQKEQRISAHQAREPRRTSKRRGSR